MQYLSSNNRIAKFSFGLNIAILSKSAKLNSHEI